MDGDVLVEAVQDFSNKISYAINPINSADVPFIICTLDIICESFKRNDPTAANLAETFRKNIGYDVSRINIASNTPDHVTQAIKDAFMKRG